MKLVHASDIHVRNLKYHKEQKQVFQKLYELAAHEEPDHIVLTGDIFHVKSHVTPEAYNMVADLFTNLANIAPVHIIAGNHDTILKNKNRLDNISPVVSALNNPNIIYHKNSGEHDLGNGFVFNILSILDPENWEDPIDSTNINIAIYHGSIAGVKTDIGWVMDRGDINMDALKPYDYALLGDIHKSNQIVGGNPKIRYAGSLCQNNFGEDDDKGFLVWDILDKTNYNVEHVNIPSPKPFVTIELTKTGRIPKNTQISDNARIRLASSNNLPLNTIRRAADIAKKRFNPESISFLNRMAGERGNVESLTDNIIREDLRDPVVQDKFIEEFLKDYHINDEVFERVCELNRGYNAIIEKDEEVGRNINWKLLSLEWDNLFNYGEGNVVNFDNLSGIVGVFGKNFSGKSSIVESMLYTLFNSTAKNSRKNLNLINQNEDFCRGKVELFANGKVYAIERTSEKYVKKLKGERTLEAKTDLDFKCVDASGEVTSLNGLSRNDTDRNIRKLFGTIDDFLYTSMASQNGALAFINEGSTKRKEILAKFLDLEIFERKFKLAKDETINLKAALKRFENRNFDEEIKEASLQLQSSESLTEEKTEEREDLKVELEIFREKSVEIQEKIKSMPAKIIDISKILENLETNRKGRVNLSTENEKIKKECAGKRQYYKKIGQFIASFNMEEYEDKKEKIDEIYDEINDSEHRIEGLYSEQENHNNKIRLLSEVPCGEEYSHCKFIKDAYVSKIELPTLLANVKTHREKITNLQNACATLNPEKVESRLDKFAQVLERKNQVANEIAQCELMIEKNEAQIAVIDSVIKELRVKQKTHDENKDIIENYSELKSEAKQIEEKTTKLISLIDNNTELLQQLYISSGAFSERAENIKNQRIEFQSLQNQFEAYDLFIKCMHPNGISYDIIKRKLPAINEEISKILANIVDFEVFFEEDGSRLNIYIKHFKYDPRPIEMGSGAEKSVAAIAIRLALLNVSNLPKSNIFVLDEPATALDEENMDGFVRILDMVKSCFKTVLLISHLDSLKDCSDTQLIIDKKGQYAYINC